MRHLLLLLLLSFAFLGTSVAAAAEDGRPADETIPSRWSAERANRWYDGQAWPCGMNYIPANAISYTEMWMPYCFDADVIDKELALAEQVGFNSVRVVLPFVVWEHDPKAFRERLDRFLEICDRRGHGVMFTLFDDCVFGSDPKLKNPWYGKQPEVLKGWYANGWTPSPGHDMVRDPKTWPRLERYVKDLISTYRDDKRVEATCANADPRWLRRARAGYYGHMTHIDHQINRLLEMVNEYGLGDDTVVCFTADHGEMMGDHHLFRKAYPYEGSARVPLLLRGPARLGLQAGGVHDQVAALRDIMPTLLDIAGAPIPACCEGRSLLPVARGEEPEWRPYLHGEHTVWNQSLHQIVDGRLKYVWFSGDGYEQLFNLRNDPQERHNLAPQLAHQPDLVRLRQALIAELTGREEGYVQDGHLVSGRPVDACLSFVREQV